MTPGPPNHPTNIPTDPGERLAMVETTLYGRDGRGGVIDDIDLINQKVDSLIRAASIATITFVCATGSMLAAIFTHTL